MKEQTPGARADGIENPDRSIRERHAGQAPNNRRFETRLVYFEGQGKSMKPFLMIVGFLAAILIVSQLVMGLLILQGQASMRTAHQHSGYLTVAVTLIYIGWSLAVIASNPKRDASESIDVTRGGRDHARVHSVDLQDWLDGSVALESAHQEPRRRLVAEERAGAGFARLR